MNSSFFKIAIGLVTAIVVLTATRLMVAPASAQDAPASCVAGNLKDNYLGKERTLGNLTVRFDKDFSGASAVDPAQIQVTPTTSPAVLGFAFPVITPAKGGKVRISMYSSIHGSGAALTAAAVLSGTVGGQNVRVEAFVSELPKKDEHDYTILELLSFVKTVTGSFANPAPKAVRVGYHLDVEETTQPSFSFSLSGG